MLHISASDKKLDRMLFVADMEKEINAREGGKHWTIVQRSLVPATVKTIKSIWYFKRKRKPDGELLKHKARMCAHGSMQIWGEIYWETYSQVVNILSVRLLLCIAKIHNLDSKAINFVLEFPQGELNE